MAQVADVEQRSAGDGRRHGGRAEQEVIGRQQQAGQQHAEREDVRACDGEMGFQQRAAHRADVAAGADDRAGRRIRHRQGNERREADDRNRPAERPQDWLIDFAMQEQQERQNGERAGQVVRADAEAFEQVVGSERAGTAARIVNHVARRPDDRARRIGRVVRPQRDAEEHDERQQRERTQVDLQAAVFKHRGRASDEPRKTEQRGRPSLDGAIDWSGHVHARQAIRIGLVWPARQLCTQNASAVGGAGHTSLVFGHGRGRRLL